jgi:hypothetical protein
MYILTIQTERLLQNLKGKTGEVGEGCEARPFMLGEFGKERVQLKYINNH